MVEVVGDLHRWPSYERDVFTKTHLTFHERFRLTVFLLANGTDPRLINNYYSYMGSLRDVSALRHINGLIHSYRTDPSFCSKYYTFDVCADAYCYLDGQPLRTPWWQQQ